jgi:mannose-6-phosphate isomerase-like protein (cupin superfamily)
MERIKRYFKRMTEGILAVLLVLLFFSFFLYLLNMVFPTGTTLKSIITRTNSLNAASLQASGGRKMVTDQSDPASTRTVAAVLSRKQNVVKSKSSEAIAWQKADEGKKLYDRDAVQTLDNSSADITFDEKTILNMGENSLIIIKRMQHDPVYKEKRSFMVLVDGDMRGRLGAGGEDSVHLEINTPAGLVRTQGGAKETAPVDFKLSVNPDKSSTIAVYSGAAEIEAGGKKVVVKENQATVVDMNGQPLEPSTLLSAVTLKSPAVGATYYYRDLQPKVRFAWEKIPEATEYRLVIARDSLFFDIVTDDRVSKDRFSHGNLKKGSYYWKVSAFSKSIEGRFSETRSFKVLQDQSPPILQVRFPPKTIYSGRYTLRGKSEPGARVFVGGTRVKTTRSGKFKYILKLEPGINVIVVEAVDGVDNVTYKSKKVLSKY